MSFLEDSEESDSRKLQSMSLFKNPWKSAEMPWTYNGPAINLMQFNGISESATFPDMKKTPIAPVKRKIEDDGFIPCKQLITEERMAQDLSCMHISSDFRSHDLNPTQTMEEAEINISMSPDEFREKLKTAQKITVLQEVRQLTKANEIIPKILLDKIETPCKALVLWKPPTKPEIEKLLSVYSNSSNQSKVSSKDQTEFEEIEIEYETSNGKGYNFDTMDLDLE